MILDLQKIRGQIDEVDRTIVECFEKRMQLTSLVAEYKVNTGKPVLDRERELQKLSTLRDLASSDYNKTGVQEIFQQIMSISRKRQYQILSEYGSGDNEEYRMANKLTTRYSRVVFQGVEGAYSFAAMKTYFDDTIESTNVPTWKEAVELVAEGKADYAVLPIENSTAGTVSDIYDLIMDYPVYIVGEQIISVNHTIMAVPGTKIEDIKIVYSHPQALAQCQKYLAKNHPNWIQEELLNTAVAAEKVAKEGKKDQAAIASQYAAEHFGLEVLEKDGLVGKANSTRFIIVSGKQTFLRSAGKIHVCLELPHETGSLYNMLSHIIYNGLNMTRIESRPIPGKNWEYRFFVEFEGNLEQPAVKNALLGMRTEASEFKLLGNY